MFFKVRLILSFLLTFAAGLLFFFHTEIQNSNQDFWKYTELFSLLGIDLIVCMLVFTTIDLSLSNEKLHKILTKSLDETKYFVLLDKKDKIKEISTLLANDLDIKPENAIRKNFFDVIENFLWSNEEGRLEKAQLELFPIQFSLWIHYISFPFELKILLLQLNLQAFDEQVELNQFLMENLYNP